jgi:hypothetical protein
VHISCVNYTCVHVLQCTQVSRNRLIEYAYIQKYRLVYPGTCRHYVVHREVLFKVRMRAANSEVEKEGPSTSNKSMCICRHKRVMLIQPCM